MIVKCRASANFSGPPSGKPPVIAQTIGPAASIIRAVNSTRNGNSTDSIWLAKLRAAIRPWSAFSRSACVIFLLNNGTNTAANAPSAKSARNRLGKRHAIRKASDARPAPTKRAINMSRTRPKTRLTKVSPPMVMLFRTRLICSPGAVGFRLRRQAASLPFVALAQAAECRAR